MYLLDRDRSVLALVARFGQLTAGQIHELAFGGLASQTPCNRTLTRLRDEHLLTRIEQRIVGGAHGGSGMYVYVLTGNGRRLFGLDGKYRPRAVNFHSLAIADSFIEFKRQERAGRITIVSYDTEPDSWATVGHVQLKPDMYVEVARPSGERLQLWLEVDLATELPRQLRDKLKAYESAYSAADAAVTPVFPMVLWVVPDSERERELGALVREMDDEAQKLFRVVTQERLASLF